MSQLNVNFLAELFKLFFKDIEVTRICGNNLEYSLIPKEYRGYKILLREGLSQYFEKDRVPSLGVIAQKFALDESVQECIEEIKDAEYQDKELIIDQLEQFIKDTKFQILNQKIVTLYNEGKKDDAIKLSAEESQKIISISLRNDGGGFLQVFKGFKEHIQRNKEENTQKDGNQKKVSSGIDCIDDISYGGFDPGDTVLWIARSGTAKSIALRWHGYSAALDGESVLHIQLEGKKAACFDRYSQMWTKQSYSNIQRGNFDDEIWKKIEKALRDFETFDKDITIYGYERFGDATVIEVRQRIIEYERIYGYFPRVIIIDSLDLLKTGENTKTDNDPSFIKYRLQRCAQKLKDIALEFNCVVITATQTGDVPYEVWNNENKVIDRSNTEGDRTLVKPFSFVFTANISRKEKDKSVCRIYVDKLRDHKGDGKTFKICTNYDNACFYDRRRTLRECVEGGEELITSEEEAYNERQAKKEKQAKKSTIV